MRLSKTYYIVATYFAVLLALWWLLDVLDALAAIEIRLEDMELDIIDERERRPSLPPAADNA